jgi:UDP-N-acetylmuramyl pentapeptide synthase
MIHPDITVVTMIGAAHLELLGSLDVVAAEKSELSAINTVGPIVLPADVLSYPSYARFASRCIVVAKVDEVVPTAVATRVDYSISDGGVGLTRLDLTQAGEARTYLIRTSSAGIARNAALAIVAAQTLGVDESQIRSGIEAWVPTGNRGLIRTISAQTFYIDCYNANPSSMVDSLCAFDRAMLDALPRCYVFGAMNELGAKAESLHHGVTRTLQLRAQDVACFVGPSLLCDAYAHGALEAGADGDQLRSVESYTQLKSFIAEFKGAIFLKGSRSYALEKLLPEGLA